MADRFYSCSEVSFIGLFCCFTSQSTAMVMVGRSVHLTTHFLGKFEQAVNQYFVYILSLVTDNNPFRINRQKGGE